MKIKELNSLRTKDTDELEKLLSGKKAEVMKVQVKVKVSKDKNLKHVKSLKRDISQLSTILAEKRLVEQDIETKDNKQEGKEEKR